MGNNWLDTYELDGDLIRTISSPAYPFVAWNLNEAAWVAEIEKCDAFDLVLPWQQEQIQFGRGGKKSKKDCYIAPSARVCILAERTRWFDRATGERVAGYRDGTFSKLNLLALIDGATAVPVVLTIKGVSAGELSKQLTTLRRNIFATARRKLGKASLSEAGFWLTLRAGQSMIVGTTQQVEITPPLLELPSKGAELESWLGERYVGSDVLAFVNTLAAEVRAWRDEDSVGSGFEDDETQPPDPSMPTGNGHAEPPAEASAEAFGEKAALLGLLNHPLMPGLVQSAAQSGSWQWAIDALDGLAAKTPTTGNKTQGGDS